MIRIQKAFKNNRLTKALTGLTKEEFLKLLESFSVPKCNKTKNRKREIGGGRRHTIESDLEKLFYILFYVKCYPTFDLAGFIFGGVDRAQTKRWTDKLLPIIEETLGRKMVLPKRKISTPEEFFKLFPEAKEIWIDGSERPTRRPKNKDKQKNRYSGKKKRHTVKNILITDKKKKILILTKTENGKEHDKTLLENSKLPENIPKKILNWLDLGFMGIKKDYPHLKVKMPKRKPRKKELSNEERKQNKKISAKRVLIENSIAGVKRLRCTTDVFRNHSEKLADQFMLIACGIWNFHLLQKI